MPSALPVLPPHVVFEQRSVENRSATIDSGMLSFADVDFAIITPAGTKDRVERNAVEWLEHLQAQVRAGRFPSEWLESFSNRYKAWKQGLELPEEGTALKNWPALSPAQFKQLQRANVRTVEEVANASAELLSRIGMGAHSLQKMAVSWLQAANDVGKVAQASRALEEENARLKAQVERLQGQVNHLKAQVEATVIEG